MISVQYIPLSVRVRAWNLSLFSQEEIESFIGEDASTIMSIVAKREKIINVDTSSYEQFVSSTEQAILEYLKVASVTSVGTSKSFIKELFHGFEIQNLKNVVRMCVSGKFQDIFYPHSITETLSVKKLLQIRSIGELIEVLDNTPYRSFKHILEQVEQEQNALYWELALDNYLVTRISNVARRLDADSKKAIKVLFLFPIQQSRIVSLFRYRFHYQVEPTEAIKYVPNLTSFMTLEQWNTLAFSVSNTEFYNHLIDMRYIHEDTPNYATALNREFQKQLEKKCIKYMHKELTSVASFLAFIQLKQIQFKKIITVLEAKSLQVSKSDVMQFL